MGVTLEDVQEDVQELREEVKELKECFHEDFLPLTEETKEDIAESRRQVREGKTVSLEEVEERFQAV